MNSVVEHKNTNTLPSASPRPLALVVFLENVGHISGVPLPPAATQVVDFVTEEYAKLLFDLQVLAYQTDLTRVSTFMLAHESSVRTYSNIGVPEAHHAVSHHRGDITLMGKKAQIDAYHVKLFAYFLDRMKSTPDGDGSLLDHSMLVYGAGMSDGNMHLNQDLPVAMVGGADGKIKGGRHTRYAKGTPMTNMYLAMLDVIGVRVDNLGDSTGKLELLTL